MSAVEESEAQRAHEAFMREIAHLPPDEQIAKLEQETNRLMTEAAQNLTEASRHRADSNSNRPRASGLHAPKSWLSMTEDEQKAYVANLVREGMTSTTSGDQSARMAREAEQHRIKVEREQAEEQRRRGIVPS